MATPVWRLRNTSSSTPRHHGITLEEPPRNMQNMQSEQRAKAFEIG